MTTFLCRYKIEHMIKYKYVPFEMGKQSYGKNKSESGEQTGLNWEEKTIYEY